MATEREIAQEAARVFRLLLDSESRLRRPGSNGRSRSPSQWQIWGRKHRRRGVADVADEVVRSWLQRGWLCEDRDGHALLTDAGRRLSAGHSLSAKADDANAAVTGAKVIDDDEGATVLVRVNHAESPLSWLHHRRGRGGKRIIDDTQFSAGEMLRRDFEAAHMRQCVTARWDIAAPVRSGRERRDRHEPELSSGALDARRRFYRAVDDLGPELASIAVDTCCFLRGLEETETAHGWPRRSAKVVLQIALTRLARHYGLGADA